MTNLENRLTTLLNDECAENESDTPDFILAKYLLNCLDAFNKAVNSRKNWYIGNDLDLTKRRKL